ncbi:Paraquat-inducible protein B [Candidatus Glomeribacter gigasporarum BEG34]|uniref:Paraquat-inducible protein B n=1 Tax=Candidatus Glomeribacter gigasporarum BEG34 TaxID=1070319 RepID=G2JAB0_9BURK|nr:MlaD family protein [Candidatus Glomeribacter gigasporarum]CCD29711.1 Paraquat-inducible protein B [Candidatus Glomeribacter gigasporarum BEG34]
MTEPKTPQARQTRPGAASNTIPAPVLQKRARWTPSLVWLVPALAALLGLALVVRALLERGPAITIQFKTAEGIEAGKTKVKYKNVNIGEVKTMTLSEDLSHVRVKVELSRPAQRFAVKDARFWIVRPRVAASGVTGLNTLLSGAYIGVDPGRSAQAQRDFFGLETPPAVTGDQKGHPFVLHSDQAGSLDIGVPVYYRNLSVGRVVAIEFDPEGAGVMVRIFIDAPYDQYVGMNTRFWHASGVDLRLDASGLKLNTQSLVTIALGGIAFEAPPGQTRGRAAPNNARFYLAADKAEAMRAPDGPPLRILLNFDQSLRGLARGAPVDFRGIALGEVESIGIDYAPGRKTVRMPVMIKIYPSRLRTRLHKKQPVPALQQRAQLLATLVKNGLRAQLRSGNLLTGQLYVALDLFPNAAPTRFDLARALPELPTMPNTLDQLQQQMADIARRIDRVPFDKIGANLNDVLENANRLFKDLNSQLAPQAKDTLRAAQQTFDAASLMLQQDAPVQTDLRRALTALTRALRSLSGLAEYLERHPEALLRGKVEDQP